MANMLALLLLLLTFTYETLSDLPLPGHLEPIGSHSTPLHVEAHIHVPPPELFFKRYIKPSVPVIFKGAAKEFPAFQRWTDDYLRKYGHWKVIVEDGKKEDRSRPTYVMSLDEFLDGYKNNDTYLVQDVVPPNPMTDEILLPKCIHCGGFQDNIQSVVMWFSSGGTKSTLHVDGIDNFECMLDGWKEYLLIDKKEVEYLLNEDMFQELDVDRVDMVKFPQIATVNWYKMHVEPGDCYLVPYGPRRLTRMTEHTWHGSCCYVRPEVYESQPLANFYNSIGGYAYFHSWYHFTNSSNTRNLAISFWLNHMYRTVNDCHLKEKRKAKLSQIEVCDERESSRSTVLELFLDSPNMTFDIFRTFFSNDDDNETTDSSKEKSREKMTQHWLRQHRSNISGKIFRKIDVNHDEVLSVDEVYETPLDTLELLVGSVASQEYSKYETMGSSNVQLGADILKERKKMFLRNEL